LRRIGDFLVEFWWGFGDWYFIHIIPRSFTAEIGLSDAIFSERKNIFKMMVGFFSRSFSVLPR